LTGAFLEKRTNLDFSCDNVRPFLFKKEEILESEELTDWAAIAELACEE